MNPAVIYFQINRLRAAADRHDLRYAQVENDVGALLLELERVRGDNEQLRRTHEQIWRLANAHEPQWERRLLGALAGLLVLLAIMLVALGWRIGR